MSDPNKHHYLPVFYLKQWCGLDGRVIRYHRPHDEVIAHPITPQNTGYEEGLYALDGYKPELRNTIEKNFMAPHVDSPAAEPLRTFLERRPLSELTLPMRQAWTRFIMSLHVRNPKRIQQITEQGAEGLREILNKDPEEYEKARNSGDPPTLVGWVERYAPALIENFGKSLLPGIVTHQQTGNEIIRMHWGVLGFSGASPNLLTCDHPLYLSHGIADPKCLIALPLSPRAVFFASRNEEHLNAIIRSNDGVVLEALNTTIVSQAAKYVYGAHDLQLGFVEEALRAKQ